MKLRREIPMIDLTRSLPSPQDSLTPQPPEKPLWKIALEVTLLAVMGYALIVLTLA